MIRTPTYAAYKKSVQGMRQARLEKIVVNSGIGRLVTANPQTRDRALADVEKILTLVTGQRPSKRPARKSIAGFKLRQGEIIGFTVTLRGKRMFDFLTRFVNVTLPRVRDFRGIPLSSIDGRGNLTVGLSEHIVFPEVAGEDVRQLYGLQVTFVPRAANREEANGFFRELGIPFAKE